MYLKSGMSNPLTSMGKKTKTLWPNKRFYMYLHQTFSLDPLWFFFHSRIGSGHVIIWKMAADKYKPPSTTKNNNHKTQTHNESTNMLMCNLCLMHVLHIHFHYQELILPGYNSTPWCELLLGCTNATTRPPFKIRFPSLLFCWAQRSEVTATNTCWILNRVNLELTKGWNTNYQLFSLPHRLQEIQKRIYIMGSTQKKRTGFPQLSVVDVPNLHILSKSPWTESSHHESSPIPGEPRYWWFRWFVQDGMPSVTMSSVHPFPHLW